MNSKESSLIWCVVVSAIIVAGLLISFLWLIRSEYRPIYGDYHTDVNVEMVGHDSLRSKQTVELYQFVGRVDTLKGEIEEIRNHYQHDIDLIIYKTDQWLAFWLAVIGIVVGFFSVLHFFSQHQAKEDFKEIERANENRMKGYDDRVRGFKKSIDQMVRSHKDKILTYVKNQQSGLETQIRKHKSELDENYLIQSHNLEILNKDMVKSKCESQLNMLMACIVSFPDPQMFESSVEKKYHIRYFLKQMCNDLEKYFCSVEALMRRNEYDISPLIIILTNIKASVIRCQPVYSEYYQNVTFQRLKIELEKMIDDLIMSRLQPKDILGRKVKMMSLLRQLVESIS